MTPEEIATTLTFGGYWVTSRRHGIVSRLDTASPKLGAHYYVRCTTKDSLAVPRSVSQHMAAANPGSRIRFVSRSPRHAEAVQAIKTLPHRNTP